MMTHKGQDISYANASAVVSVNRSATKRSLLARDALYQDKDSLCLYWNAKVFDEERVQSILSSFPTEVSGREVVYIRPAPKGTRNELPEEGQQVSLVNLKRFGTNDSSSCNLFVIEKRLYDTNQSNHIKARKTECAVICPVHL